MKMSILKKLFLIITLLIISAIVVLFYSAHNTGHKLLEEVGNAKALAVIEIGRADVEHMMVSHRVDKISHALRNIETTGQANDVAVLRADGSVCLSGSMAPHVIQIDLKGFRPFPHRPRIQTRPFRRNDSTFMDVLTSFQNKPECYGCHTADKKIIGYLIATVPLQDLQTIAAYHRKSNIILILATFAGLAACIFAVMYFMVARPTRRLGRNMKVVMEGIPALRSGKRLILPPSLVTTPYDEIGELARLFTRLIEQLNNAYQQMLHTHDGQLARADQLSTTGEMAASIAHEIKNPVAGLSAALQVFRRKLGESDPGREIVDEMLEQVGRINNAVNDLLSYARPTQPEYTQLDLNHTIKKSIALLQPVADQQRVTIVETTEQSSLPIRGDEKLLQQLLWNILLNAIQAMPSGGPVTISTRILGNVVQLEIRDKGKGIPEQELNMIFRPFFTTKHKGTGLGMPISKRIVEQHGGNLLIRSTLGKGTTVLIRLPIGEEHDEG